MQDEVVQITTSVAAETSFSIRLYPVYDLTQENIADGAVEQLAEEIAFAVAVAQEDAARGTGAVEVWPHPATLVVIQTDEGHGTVEKLLDELWLSQAKSPALNEGGASGAALDAVEWRVYHLPPDDEGNAIYAVEKIADILRHTMARTVGELAPEEMVIEIVGPHSIAIRGNAPVQRQIEKTLRPFGIGSVWYKAMGEFPTDK